MYVYFVYLFYIGILETVQLSFGDDIYLKTLSWDTEVAYSVKESVMEVRAHYWIAYLFVYSAASVS